MQKRVITPEEKKLLFRFSVYLWEQTTEGQGFGFEDIDKREDVKNLIEKKINTNEDLPILFRRLSNLDLVNPHHLLWKTLEMIFGPLDYKDDIKE